jgi:carboxypeptidase PM20D1
VLVLSGHDEETTGTDGAAKIAALLAARHIVPEVVLDEGSIIADGIVPGVKAPVALVGVAEKGYATLDLEVAIAGGHSSMPAQETAIGVLARAVDRLGAHPMPARLSETARAMFEFLGPSMAPLPRFLSANLWLGAPLLRRGLGGSPSGNALIRTTIAPTLLSGGVSENVLAPSARATVNFRILPGDTVAGVVEHARRAIADERVRLTLHAGAQEPSTASRIDGPGFAAIQRAVAETFPGTLVAPSLVLAATDARYLAPACDCVYRFVPFRLRADDLPRLHGVDERVSVEGYGDAIRFYRRFLRAAAF